MAKQITAAQQKVLVGIIELNPRLKTGKLDHSFTNVDKKNAWAEVSNTLNEMPGAKKDATSWEKCWKDMVRTTRDKLLKIKEQINQTGNKAKVEVILSPLQERISNMIGQVFVHGHSKSKESQIGQQTEHEGTLIIDMLVDVVEENEILDNSEYQFVSSVLVALTSDLVTPLVTPKRMDDCNAPTTSKSSTYPVSFELKSTAKSRRNVARQMINPIARQHNRLRQSEKKLQITGQAYDRFSEFQQKQLNMAEEQLKVSKAILETKKQKVTALKDIATAAKVISKYLQSLAPTLTSSQNQL